MSADQVEAVRSASPRARGTRARAAAAAAALIAALLAGCGTGLTGGGPAGAAGGSATGAPATPSTDPADAGEPTPSPQPTDDPDAADQDPTPTPTPTAGPTTPAPAPSAPAAPEPAPAPPAESAPAEPAPAVPVEPAHLRRGDEGPAVTTLQQQLAGLGYFLTEPDGTFGAATQQAVWALQKAAGLGRDGVVGPRTQAALDAGTRPTPRTTAGRAIEIDLERQLLLAVDDGVVTRVVNASSGNGETYVALGRTQRAYTPTGSYTVVRQIDGMHESTLELGSMYRPKYFRGGWAVHGSGSIPPWPASHGCVRVSNAAMDWIWDTWGAPLGTAVVVY